MSIEGSTSPNIQNSSLPQNVENPSKKEISKINGMPINFEGAISAPRPPRSSGEIPIMSETTCTNMVASVANRDMEGLRSISLKEIIGDAKLNSIASEENKKDSTANELANQESLNDHAATDRDNKQEEVII